MSRAMDDVLSVCGGGQDDTGQLVLSVLTKGGGHGVLRVTEQAAMELLVCVPLAVLGRRIRGSA